MEINPEPKRGNCRYKIEIKVTDLELDKVRLKTKAYTDEFESNVKRSGDLWINSFIFCAQDLESDKGD